MVILLFYHLVEQKIIPEITKFTTNDKDNNIYSA